MICLFCFICSCYGSRSILADTTCLCPTLAARRGLTKHFPCLLYLLLLRRAACPRSERSVGGPVCIALMLDFSASRPVCKRAPRAGERLVILSRMVTHAVTSMPKTAKCACVALQVRRIWSPFRQHFFAAPAWIILFVCFLLSCSFCRFFFSTEHVCTCTQHDHDDTSVQQEEFDYQSTSRLHSDSLLDIS